MCSKILAVFVLAATAAVAAPLPELAPPDFSRIKPADFADDELDLPYLLAHLHTVANAVVAEGELQGLFTLPVWRAEKDNRSYNARIMENHLALAWFYCSERPWNPYYGDPALRARLEAVLQYWCDMQSDDGRFSEYKVEGWNLPGTAFATKFMGQTLHLLRGGPPIDPELHARVTEVDRKAIMAVLTRDDMLAHGRTYANQYSNVWPGALAYLALHPDAEMERLLRERLAAHDENFQSPAGYFYELHGPDWSYNLGTEQTNHESAVHFAADPGLVEMFQEQTRLFYDWLSYNAVCDGPGFMLNRAIETRQRRSYILPTPTGLFDMTAAPAAVVEMARPFAGSREEMTERRQKERARLVREWPAVAPLRSFTPYHFLARGMTRSLPTAPEREAALAKLPYLARDRFVHQRVDSRHPVSYTFIRRPGYYAAFNAGKRLERQQRYGLGLLWHPELEGVLQSQTGSAETAWGTRAEGPGFVYEAGDVNARFLIDGQPVEPRAGNRDLAEGELVVEYPIGAAGQKRLIFEDAAIRVEVVHPGEFTEHLPLLATRGQKLELDAAGARLGRLRVEFTGANAETEATGENVGGKSIQLLRLRGTDKLSYRLSFAGS